MAKSILGHLLCFLDFVNWANKEVGLFSREKQVFCRETLAQILYSANKLFLAPSFIWLLFSYSRKQKNQWPLSSSREYRKCAPSQFPFGLKVFPKNIKFNWEYFKVFIFFEILKYRNNNIVNLKSK